MRKLRNFWHNNSVLLVLLLILIACMVAITVVVVTYFVGDSNTKYGDRLKDADKVTFKESEQKEIQDKIKEDKKVLDVSVRVSGKTIYLKIEFSSDVTLVEAQGKALTSLEYFSEEVLEFYDIEYMIEALSTENTDGYQLMGSHNVGGTGGIVWNNNTKVSDDEEE